MRTSRPSSLAPPPTTQPLSLSTANSNSTRTITISATKVINVYIAPVGSTMLETEAFTNVENPVNVGHQSIGSFHVMIHTGAEGSMLPLQIFHDLFLK